MKRIRTYNLFPSGELIIVAVSGGADSLALLHILHSLTPQLNIRLHIATFDHATRPESAADVRFVAGQAAKLGLPISTGRVDVPKLAQEQSISLELAARQARYAFLAETARQQGAGRVAVAHHADDQAETVLMRVLRGTGLRGLRGMQLESPLPGAPDLTLVRPLLHTTRAELVTYCQGQNLQPRQDASNADLDFTRNYIRHQVLPFLKSGVNPNLEAALIRLAENAAVDQDYLMQQYQTEVEPFILYENHYVSINRVTFEALHPALQRRFITQAAAHLLPDAAQIGHDHITRAVQVALENQVGAVAELPGGVHLRLTYDNLLIEEADKTPNLPSDTPLLPSEATLKVVLPGETIIPERGWSLRATIGDDETQAQAQLSLSSYTSSKVILRSRQPGDRFAPLGLGGHTQKVKKWMIDHKVPRHLRDQIPLLVVDGEIAVILWGVQWPIAETFALGDSERYVIKFFVYFSTL